MTSDSAFLNEGTCPALFGADPFRGIVNAEYRDGDIILRVRENGELKERKEKLAPFLWLNDTSCLKRYAGSVKITELEGNGFYKYLAETETFSEMLDLSRSIADWYGVSATHPDSPQLFIPDPVQQYLIRSGRTYFKGLGFDDAKRLQIFVSAEDGHILGIAVAAGNDERVFEHEDEKRVLEDFLAFVKEYDPDIIEGFGLYNEILPLLDARSRALKVNFGIARHGKVSYRRSRLQVAEKNLDYTRWEVPGRELADLWVLAQLYDVSAREMESFDILETARVLKIAADDKSSLGMARIIRDISRILSYPYFLQAGIFPYSYQNVMLRGTATRINTLFFREYLRCGCSMPMRNQVKQYAGGLTAQEHVGIAENVLHCDVQSLYPSIMMTWKIGPKLDSLGCFLDMLGKLRNFRLEAKARQRKAEEDMLANSDALERKQFWQAMQTTFKILINSFYGYLAFPQGYFADFEAASDITERGRKLLSFMIDWLKKEGASIIEVDTDGIYFVPPEEYAGITAGQLLVSLLNEALPEGINVELDGAYKAMFCHKMKNYALLEMDGSVILRGSGLRSRSMEPFLRETLAEMINLALNGRTYAIKALFEKVKEDILARRIPVAKLAKTENLIDSPESYLKKISQSSRNRAASYELAIASGRNFRAGDSITYYVTGDKATVRAWESSKLLEDYDPARPDENIKYYLAKLRDLHKKFAESMELEPWKA